MKHVIMEFLGTYSIVLIRGLINITSERVDASTLSSSLFTAIVIMVFCFFSHNISNGYFNPYFAMSDMIFKVISMKKALGKGRDRGYRRLLDCSNGNVGN